MSYNMSQCLMILCFLRTPFYINNNKNELYVRLLTISTGVHNHKKIGKIMLQECWQLYILSRGNFCAFFCFRQRCCEIRFRICINELLDLKNYTKLVINNK